MEDLVFHDSCHGNPYLHLLIKTILKWLQFHAKWQKIVPALGLICGFCVKDGIHPCTVQTKTKSCSLCVTIVWNWPIYLHGWSLVCDPLIWNSKFSTQGLFLCSMLTSLVHYSMLFFVHVKMHSKLVRLLLFNWPHVTWTTVHNLPIRKIILYKLPNWKTTFPSFAFIFPWCLDVVPIIFPGM